MALVANTPPVRVLLLDDDPAGALMLRQLLELLPGYRCTVSIHQPVFELVPADAGDFDLCFISNDYAPGKLLEVTELLRRAPVPPRIYCIVNDEARLADRVETVRAIRSGIEDFLIRDDISPRILRDLLGSLPLSRAQPNPKIRLSASQEATNTASFDSNTNGQWVMNLVERSASFDAGTLKRLGHDPVQIGTTVGEWKQLIHRDDVDRLVTELNSVLEGIAPPHPISYRLRAADGSWYAVVSDAINVEIDDDSKPAKISGTFYPADSEEQDLAVTSAPQASVFVEATEEADCFEPSPVAKAVFHQVAPGKPFVVARLNQAALNLEGLTAEQALALSAADLGPRFDNFDFDAVLTRVHETGINESHRVMAMIPEQSSIWRRYQFCRLNDGSVLAEFEDISAEVQKQQLEKSESALWEHIVRAMPELALLLDEDGTVSQTISGSPVEIGLDSSSLAGSPVLELFGINAGTECMKQVNRTLNTGKMSRFNIEIGNAESGIGLECSLAPLHSTPGSQRRLILTLHDATEHRQLAIDLGLERDQFREALHRVPAILYLKDVEGRYLLINPHFEAAYGIEEEMIVGKTDFEVFPDELAAEIYETDHKVIETLEPFDHVHTIGLGDARRYYRSFNFPVCDRNGELSSLCGLSIPLERLGIDDTLHWSNNLTGSGNEIRLAASSVVGRVEKVLTESHDYDDILGQIQHLVETTTRAQDLIRGIAGHDASPVSGNVFMADILVREILELERILLPPSTTLKPLIDANLPIRCDPLVFQQIMLRAIRHARSQLHAGGTLQVQLHQVSVAPRGCASCNEPFEGAYIELLIKESDSQISDSQLLRLFRAEPDNTDQDREHDNLAEIHRLVHQQGGHLLVERAMPAGTSLHLLFEDASSEQLDSGDDKTAEATKIAHFPFNRSWLQKD